MTNSFLEVGERFVMGKEKWFSLTLMMWSTYFLAILESSKALNVNYYSLMKKMWGDYSQSTFFALHQLLDLTKDLEFCSLLIAPLILLSVVMAVTPENFRQKLRKSEIGVSGIRQTPSIFINKLAFEEYLHGIFTKQANLLGSLISMLGPRDSIIEDISGGSGAATFLVQNGAGDKIAMKIADGAEATERLLRQYMSLRELSSYGIKTVTPINLHQRKPKTLAYSTSFVDGGIKLSTALLEGEVEALAQLRHLLEQMSLGAHSKAPKRSLSLYLHEIYFNKIHQVYTLIQNNVNQLSDDGLVEVNNREIPIVTPDRMIAALQKFPQITFECKYVHGDLTLENMIYVKKTKSLVVLDPNPNQLIKHPSVDFGKILQSTSLNYENVSKEMAGYTWKRGTINYVLEKPALYEEAQILLKDHIMSSNESGGDEIYSQSYAQFLMHTLRLLPYKLETNPDLFPYFLAELSLKVCDILGD
jgi:hypothetical protein